MRHRFSIYVKRFLAALYFLWFIVHLGILFYSNESEDNTAFWPFIPEEESMHTTYGLTEFVVYTGGPLVLTFLVNLFTRRRIESEEAPAEQKIHRHDQYLGALLKEKIRAEELQQELNTLKGLKADQGRLAELKQDLEKFQSTGVNHWYDRVEVRHKYRDEADL